MGMNKFEVGDYVMWDLDDTAVWGIRINEKINDFLGRVIDTSDHPILSGAGRARLSIKTDTKITPKLGQIGIIVAALPDDYVVLWNDGMLTPGILNSSLKRLSPLLQLAAVDLDHLGEL